MSARPWYPVSREFWTHPDWHKRSAHERLAWLYLLSVTRWRDGDGILRGQARTSAADIGREVDKPRARAHDWLKRWASIGAISYEVEVDEANRPTGIVVTVLGYERWAANAKAYANRADGNGVSDEAPDAKAYAVADARQDAVADAGKHDDSEVYGEVADARPDAKADAAPDARPDASCIGHELINDPEQQRAHAREAAAAADPRLSWEAVRDLWVETRRGYYDGTPTMKLGGPHLGPVAFVAERLTELADEVGVDDAVAHVAAVFEAYLEDKEHWFLTNQHPLAWLTKADEGSTEPRWHQWAMRDPWYAARQSNSHHTAQSEAPPTSSTSKSTPQSHGHHVADPSLPAYPRATGEDADEVREVLQQLVNDGLDAIRTGVLCRAGDGLALVFSDDMDMLLSAKRVSRYLPDVACLHGAVEREQRGAA